MIQILGLIVGAIIELYHGYSMSTYLWMAGISVAGIVACILSIFAGIAKWGEDGGLIGFLITIVGGGGRLRDCPTDSDRRGNHSGYHGGAGMKLPLLLAAWGRNGES